MATVPGESESFQQYVDTSGMMYSRDWCERLTFRACDELCYPVIMSPGSVMGFRLVRERFYTAEANLIRPDELVPSNTDLIQNLHLIDRLEGFFNSGYHSMQLEFTYEGENYTRTYSFKKLKLFVMINSHAMPVYCAKLVASAIVENMPFAESPTTDVTKFLGLRITSPLSGFFSDAIPLWKLGFLMKEEWLEDDLCDILQELAYFRYGILDNTKIPRRLFLSPIFIRNAMEAQKRNFLTQELLSVRERLRTTTITNISIVLYHGDSPHFSAVRTANRKDNCWEHGDTMGSDAPAWLLPTLQWVFARLSLYPEGLRNVAVPRQGLYGQGGGSCAIGALNFAEVGVNPAVHIWQSSIAAEARMELLKQLVCYHLVAKASPEPKASWTKKAIDEDFSFIEEPDSNSTFYTYAEFNLLCPTDAHPLRNLLASSPKLFPSASALSPAPAANPARQVHIPAGSKRKAQMQATRRRRSPSLEIYDNTPLRNATNTTKRTKREPSLEIIEPLFTYKILATTKSEDENNIIDLTLSSPLSKPQPKREKKVEFSTERRLPLTFIQHGDIRSGETFETLEAAIDRVLKAEAAIGHHWNRGQSKPLPDGTGIKKLMLRCNHYREHKPVHNPALDPGDHREGRSIRTDCKAHVNIVNTAGLFWRFTVVELAHNHPPEGGVPHRPITNEQKSLIQKLSTSTSTQFNRSQIAGVLGTLGMEDDGGTSIQPKQISNAMTSARRSARDEIISIGGDVNAILQYFSENPAWRFFIKLNRHGVMTSLFWLSPEQVVLVQRYWDVLINDNTYNKNNVGYALGIGIIVDGYGKPRNAWYSLQEKEDIETHTWILKCHMNIVGARKAPQAFVSDRSQALIAARQAVAPLANHIYCLRHLTGNINTHLRSKLRSSYLPFIQEFWALLRSVSPSHFERRYDTIVSQFPLAKSYLDDNIYTCRERWGWAWTCQIFTAGIRYTNSVEGENRIIGTFAGPKTSLLQLFNGLNERSSKQTAAASIKQQNLSRKQQPKAWESVFPNVLKLVRQYCEPHGLTVSYKEMERAGEYMCTTVTLPDGIQTWSEFAVELNYTESTFQWLTDEHVSIIEHENDNAYIATKWLLHLVNDRGVNIQNLFQIVHAGTKSVHYLALISSATGEHICDCCMILYLGIPCRHYYALLRQMNDLRFSLGLIRKRWLNNPDLELQGIPIVSATGTMERSSNRETLVVHSPTHTTASFASGAQSPTARPSDRVPPQVVYHEMTSTMGPLMQHIHSHDDLQKMIAVITDATDRQLEEIRQEQIR